MTGSLSGLAFLLGIPQGFFITGVIWINQFPDYEADRQAGKDNLVVRLGSETSRYFYCAIMLMAYVSVIIMASLRVISPLILISFFSFPLTFKAMQVLWREYLSLEGLIPAQALTIQTLIAHGLLLSLVIGITRFF
jgi:1,4-dihydroxy-2-naphthoate octaprenyltransferase